uniref:Parabutoporin n=1 Tax=Parabuthus schlechteri TaxID=190110 RepID=NDB25_PARSC|nr:RecName: Full=Parabutoporin; Short=PP; AltName: Full=Non-disulfide-bridged peptide 2.5; Short=NDBP-2.5; AltName: Full=Non-disulfide-bridged peptide 3.2; Short=NDBP-3.2 [Parabuthus schlechteri]
FKLGSFLKKAWKSKLAKKLRAKGKEMLKDYAKGLLEGGSEEVPGQ